MKKVIAPPSVKKKVRIQILKRFLLLLVYSAVAYVIADYVFKITPSDAEQGSINTILSFVLIMAVPFILSGIPLKLIDKSWYGEILEFETSTARPEEIDTHSKMEITQTALIRTPSGKLYKHTLYDEGILFHDNSGEIYRVGDTVAHVYGTEYLAPIKTALDKGRPDVCVFCGHKSTDENKICRNCGCSVDIRLKGSAGRR